MRPAGDDDLIKLLDLVDFRLSGSNQENKGRVRKYQKWRISWKQPLEVFLEISQNSQENTGARFSFLIKLKKSLYPLKTSEKRFLTFSGCLERLANLLKERLWHRYFLVDFAKFLGILSQNTCGQLLLHFKQKRELSVLWIDARIFLGYYSCSFYCFFSSILMFIQGNWLLMYLLTSSHQLYLILWTVHDSFIYDGQKILLIILSCNKKRASVFTAG